MSLTPDELARVANIVTKGRDYTAKSGYAEARGSAADAFGQVWDANFGAWHTGRSQALLVIEWLAANEPRLQKRPTGGYLKRSKQFLTAIRNKDITALQRMVIELHGDTAI